jgi:argininosuccinate lyase
MDKLWAGRFSKSLDRAADDFNSSIATDGRMYRQDIRGSMAHAAMLGARGIISAQDVEEILAGLEGILADMDGGVLEIDPSCEDIHMFVEAELTKRIGDAGRRLHTARSRNDQVATDLRLYLRDECGEILGLLKELLVTIVSQAARNSSVIMPGYTHLQRAQPITFAHHLMAYAMMFARDVTRVKDAVSHMNVSPLGACALAGTTYDTDRRMVAGALEFDEVAQNSIDAVSDRDFCIELCAAFATIMMHLSRFSEEIVLWASWEFKFIELDDSFTTGSSIMPQKKNPDIAELVRGKTGRVYGDLMATLTMLKGLPLAYNKDMQEDKDAIFDSVDTVKACLYVFRPMLETMRVLPDNMRAAAAKGFINATDCADYLVRKGMPFRTAYKITGELVAKCIAAGTTLEELPLTVYAEYTPLFAEDIYDAINLENCAARRISEGGTSEASIQAQIKYITEFISGV